MTDRTPKSSPEPQVEVVADQAEDGTYEIRVERQSGAHAAVSDTGGVSLTAPGGGHRRSASSAWIAGGVTVAAVAVAAVIGAALGGPEAPPPLPEPEPVETFRAFTIQVPQVPTLRTSVLRADIGLQSQRDAGESEAEGSQAEGSGADEAALDSPGDVPAGEPLNVPAAEAEFDDRTLERLRNVRVSSSAVALPSDEEGDDTELSDEEYAGEGQQGDEYADDEYADDEYGDEDYEGDELE